MYRKISIILVTLLSLTSCVSSVSHEKYATEEELQQYTGAYYVTFTLFPKDSHPMIMGGISKIFDIETLRENNLDDFVESFYEQFTYSPTLVDSFYWGIYECLGLDKETDEVSWSRNFYEKFMHSNLIEKYNFKLQDSSYIVIQKYRLSSDLEILYLDDNECVGSNSIELDIDKIKAIDKIAVLLDRK